MRQESGYGVCSGPAWFSIAESKVISTYNYQRIEEIKNTTTGNDIKNPKINKMYLVFFFFRILGLLSIFQFYSLFGIGYSVEVFKLIYCCVYNLFKEKSCILTVYFALLYIFKT